MSAKDYLAEARCRLAALWLEEGPRPGLESTGAEDGLKWGYSGVKWSRNRWKGRLEEKIPEASVGRGSNGSALFTLDLVQQTWSDLLEDV